MFALQATAQVPDVLEAQPEASQNTGPAIAAPSPESPTSDSLPESTSLEPNTTAASVLDYEASEQVSEDLSVAFPVDI